MAFPVWASAQGDGEFITWLDFNFARTISPKWALGGDGGTRGIVTSRGFAQVYLRPTATFRLGDDLRLAAAVSGVYTARSPGFDLFEFRMAQEVHAVWPKIGSFRFTHRLRNEERFYRGQRIESKPRDDSAFENRLRYRLGAESGRFHVSPFFSEIKIVAGLEYFETFKSRVNSKRSASSRASLGYAHGLNDRWSYALVAIWQRSGGIFDSEPATDHFILRLRIYCRKAI